MNKLYHVLVLMGLSAGFLLGSGVIIPDNDNYPRDLLKNKSSEITINIQGNVAETIVYEEFLNDGYDETDGVYSFPLPIDARSLAVYYWRNDTLYQARLRVEPQETNPGTGEGGIAAIVNDYIGRNGLRIKLLEIEPGGIQKVELHYLSTLDYYNGVYSYKFPLNTSKLFNYPVDYLDININIESNQQIIDFGSSSHPELLVSNQNSHSIKANYNKSKAYLANDFEFYYTIENNDLSIQFLSTNLDSTGGHFALFYNSQDISESTKKVDNKIIFVLENSSNMYGAKLNQSIDAIKEGLRFLSKTDKFNITLFNYNSANWMEESQIADSANINSAIQFLDNINTGGGINLESGLENALSQFSDTSNNNSIILFTTGISPIDLPLINSLNNFETGIFCIGTGSNVSRARLEMLSDYNHGLTYYFTESNYNRKDLLKFIEKITHPIANNLKLTFEKEDIYDLTPNSSPSLFAGSSFSSAGKYSIAENSFFAILGSTRDSQFTRVFQVDFVGDSVSNSLADKIWAKTKMDRLEWEIEINGESPELKDSLIDLSLTYGIRCRYTSYIADYSDAAIVSVEEDLITPKEFTMLINNYPNPFNPTTTFKFFISSEDAGKVKLLRIYNILGQLVAVIDISSYSAGWHEIVFNGKDYYGCNLASGTYIASMQIGNQIVNTIKIVMLK